MYRFLLSVILVATAVFSQAGQAATAIFAGGCFWCMESAYQDVEGVTEVVSGFTGGTHPNPSYRGGHDGHYESILVTYDPQRIGYAQLLEIFWRNIDPFDAGGQFCDRGESYRTALFVESDAERKLAIESRERVVAKFPQQRVVTPVLDRSKFFPVEEAHQDYYMKNPLRYKYYRYSCGRDKRLEEIWGSAHGE
jgi:peptide-methionine (S)-S-oxide reductase